MISNNHDLGYISNRLVVLVLCVLIVVRVKQGGHSIAFAVPPSCGGQPGVTPPVEAKQSHSPPQRIS